jgi:branched-chain amino acid transport system ATP-binding protein
MIPKLDASTSEADYVSEQSQQRSSRASLLEVRDLDVSYGKAEVVHEASFEVRSGEFVVLLGRNGAGKSTTLHALSGLIPKRGGRVVFDGLDISNRKPRVIMQMGLVQVLQNHRVFTSLSVEENLLIGAYARSESKSSLLDDIYSTFPELSGRRKLRASQLSGGQQQILAVAQGLIARPKLLILDEPSSGLAPMVVDRILEVSVGLCREGMAVLLVEQMVEKALKFSDFCYLINAGRVTHGLASDRVRESGLLDQTYLGGAVVH